MKKTRANERLKKRYLRLASSLASTGPILQGSISERRITGEKAKKQRPQKTYGPYYQWTFKRQGKTVTVNLSSTQAKIYQTAIDNHRKLSKILKEMMELSEQILAAETEGVKRRKPRE